MAKGLSRLIALGEAISDLSVQPGEHPRLAPRFDKNGVTLISPLKVLEALLTAESLHRRGGGRCSRLCWCNLFSFLPWPPCPT
ncbi:hypothetical protein K2Z83_12065 [Oscillochloris sp. ZM17-4]|uniref:hypothetical protein n=1 Tax=Oscillochloris sp. ZM17-4 TaxID=2866714 RepID=UPI001C73DE9E|nr:hypothetical protein [Oscillochloris sp. ZM17-4]MBX0328411.1 hypothetical protein [Oscillochloris sp. ZM17-4]